MKACALVVLGLMVLLISSCTVGSREVVTESRAVSGFDEIYFSAIGALMITQGDAESLTIRAESNLMRRIRSEVRDGMLYIEMSGGVGVAPTRPITYDLTVTQLTSVDLAGVGSIYAGALDVDHLDLTMSGAGKIAIRALQADTLTVHHTGIGQCELAGQVQGQEVLLTGAGEYDAGELDSEAATVKVTGLGKAVVWATETLDIGLAGAGSVSYYGQPRVTQNVTGLGRVRSLGSH